VDSSTFHRRFVSSSINNDLKSNAESDKVDSNDQTPIIKKIARPVQSVNNTINKKALPPSRMEFDNLNYRNTNSANHSTKYNRSNSPSNSAKQQNERRPSIIGKESGSSVSKKSVSIAAPLRQDSYLKSGPRKINNQSQDKQLSTAIPIAKLRMNDHDDEEEQLALAKELSLKNNGNTGKYFSIVSNHDCLVQVLFSMLLFLHLYLKTQNVLPLQATFLLIKN
jgi:hypothetical protein